MSTELTRSNIARRRRTLNTITFPRALRDAIPANCGGRVLKLDSISGSPSDHRVHLMLTARETGKLTGEFNILVDIDREAARALAETLAKLLGQKA